MANPKVSRKDADFSKTAPAAIENLAEHLGPTIEQYWKGTIPARDHLEADMALVTMAISGIEGIDDLLCAQRTIETINSCRGEDEQLAGLPPPIIEKLGDALSALTRLASHKMFHTMESLQKRPLEAA